MDLLLTSIALGETIDFILDEIYVPFCKKSLFKKILNKLMKGCTFLADGRLISWWKSNGWPDFTCSFQHTFCKNGIRYS